MDTLPIELLARSLSFLPFHDLLTTTHVCSTWREVALAEPSLWTELSLDGATGSAFRRKRRLGRYSWSYPSFIDDLLLRSLSLPVSLRISGFDKTRLLAFCAAVRRYMHHIGALRIFNTTACFILPHELLAFTQPSGESEDGLLGSQLIARALCVPGPVLAELWIHDQWPGPVTLTGDFFTLFPRLRSLCLVCWGLSEDLVPVQSVRRVALDRLTNQPPAPDLFRQFPGMRELAMTDVGRSLALPVMGPRDTLHTLTIVPASDDWQFTATRNIAPQRIAHITIQRPSPTVCREFLGSLPSIQTVSLDHPETSVAGLHLHASTADRAMSRTLNMLCLRVLGDIFEGWKTTCFASVFSVAVSDKVSWESVLPFLSVVRSVRELTFLVSPWTAAEAIRREGNYDTIGGPHLLDSEQPTSEIAWPHLPSLRTLRFSAVEPALLDPQAHQDALPDEVGLGGWAAHRVSATLFRAMLGCFGCWLDLLVFDHVVVREGADAPLMSELREMVKRLVITPPRK